MTDTDAQRDALVAAARSAAQHAYAPYSGFAVGAAIRLEDDSSVTGCNMENASYGLSLCAETVAVAKASSDGALRSIVSIAGAGGTRAVHPCGSCHHILTRAAQL